MSQPPTRTPKHITPTNIATHLTTRLTALTTHHQQQQQLWEQKAAVLHQSVKLADIITKRYRQPLEPVSPLPYQPPHGINLYQILPRSEEVKENNDEDDDEVVTVPLIKPHPTTIRPSKRQKTSNGDAVNDQPSDSDLTLTACSGQIAHNATTGQCEWQVCIKVKNMSSFALQHVSVQLCPPPDTTATTHTMSTTIPTLTTSSPAATIDMVMKYSRRKVAQSELKVAVVAAYTVVDSKERAVHHNQHLTTFSSHQFTITTETPHTIPDLPQSRAYKPPHAAMVELKLTSDTFTIPKLHEHITRFHSDGRLDLRITSTEISTATDSNALESIRTHRLHFNNADDDHVEMVLVTENYRAARLRLSGVTHHHVSRVLSIVASALPSSVRVVMQ